MQRLDVTPTTLTQAALGRRPAQEALLAEASGFVRDCLKRLLPDHPDELDDLHQAALISILAEVSAYNERTPFESWLTGICANVASEFLHKVARRQGGQLTSVVLDEAASVRSDLDLQRHAEQQQALELCAHVLDGMSAKHRTVFVLKTVYGHSIKEIAELTQAAESTTRLRLYYARRAFRRALKAVPARPAAFSIPDA